MCTKGTSNQTAAVAAVEINTSHVYACGPSPNTV
jgi:hypothetical protein